MINFNAYLDSRFYKLLVATYIVEVLVIIVFSIDIFSPYHSYTNKSDSMIPAINQGSQTIVKSLPRYFVGDAIAYHANIDGLAEIVTHRIVDIGGNVYTTKGDNNAVADRELVKPRLIVGKVIFIIPYLGHLITFAKSLIGTWLLIIIPAMIIAGSEFIRIIKEIESYDPGSTKDGTTPAPRPE